MLKFKMYRRHNFWLYLPSIFKINVQLLVFYYHIVRAIVFDRTSSGG